MIELLCQHLDPSISMSENLVRSFSSLQNGDNTIFSIMGCLRFDETLQNKYLVKCQTICAVLEDDDDGDDYYYCCRGHCCHLEMPDKQLTLAPKISISPGQSGLRALSASQRDHHS